MKYLKYFEKLNKYQEADVIEIIRSTIDAYTFVDDYDMDHNCPFITELALIHQKEYIKELYYSLKDEASDDDKELNVSLDDFTKIYNKLLKKAPEAILNYLLKQPELYKKYKDYFDDYGLDIPDFIINANKYNL